MIAIVRRGRSLRSFKDRDFSWLGDSLSITAPKLHRPGCRDTTDLQPYERHVFAAITPPVGLLLAHRRRGWTRHYHTSHTFTHTKRAVLLMQVTFNQITLQSFYIETLTQIWRYISLWFSSKGIWWWLKHHELIKKDSCYLKNLVSIESENCHTRLPYSPISLADVICISTMQIWWDLLHIERPFFDMEIVKDAKAQRVN